MESNSKKSLVIVYSIIATILLIVAILGFSVAAFTWQFTGQNNSISTGNVSMNLLESTDAITINNALPMSDSEGKSLSHNSGDSGVFDFAITTYASGAPGNITYSISISKTIVDAEYTPLADNQIKLYLVAFDGDGETQVMAPTLVSNIITSGTSGTLTFDRDKTNYLTHNHSTVNSSITQKYRLKMWIADTVDASSWTTSTKYQYKLRINTSGQLN